MTAPTTTALGDIGVRVAPSRLALRLGDPGATGVVGAEHPDSIRAFVRARQQFLAGERIDMRRLAAELGVDRTSLFRWVGNRDALLAEVLWSLAVPTLNSVEATVSARPEVATGSARIVAVLSGFVDALVTAPYFRAFLTREPARALRLLTTKESEMQRRFVATVEHLIVEETSAGRLRLALPARELASLLVRIVESFSYADIISGELPSAERAQAALQFVLRGC